MEGKVSQKGESIAFLYRHFQIIFIFGNLLPLETIIVR